MIAATGVGIASVPLLPFDIAVLTGAVLASAGLGIGLSGQLVALLRLAAGNRISRAAALFQVAQNLGYGVGIGVPMALLVRGLGVGFWLAGPGFVFWSAAGPEVGCASCLARDPMSVID